MHLLLYHFYLNRSLDKEIKNQNYYAPCQFISRYIYSVSIFSARENFQFSGDRFFSENRSAQKRNTLVDRSVSSSMLSNINTELEWHNFALIMI